jgi:ribosomal-protein-alanine N-acetyltransferase
VTILVTPRLRLRPMRADDAAALLAVFGDRRVMDAFDSPPFTRAEMDGWVARNLEHRERFGYGLFTIELAATGAVIGDCGLERTDIDGATETELGYDLHADQWRRGLATEAASAVARYAFDTLGLERMVSLIREGNGRSQRVAEKVGMRLERRLTRAGTPYTLWAIPRPPEAEVADP